ncbi:hypothetical protein [Thiomicrorhabdus chilensis]|uniref:hypothetical protein n=1 Tax=Thiomicrorhabdus chilensis TaxID=63656 RepID=UPI000408BAF9|nr:hypothetical protein [Thiomicrorhabdus chilensis]
MKPYYYLLTGLLILTLAVLFSIFITSKPERDAHLPPAQTPVATKNDAEVNKSKSEVRPSTEEQATLATPPSNQNRAPAPLKIELDQLKTGDENTASELGPVKPLQTLDPVRVEEQPGLPLQENTSKDKLLYGYGGKEEQDHKVMIGVQKGDVTIKSDIKKGDEETEVQHIEIEIKLPK